MTATSTQIGSEQLHLVPGHVCLLDSPEGFSEKFRNGLDCLAQEMTTTTSAAEALAAIQGQGPDAVLVPYELADMSGLEFLAQLAEHGLAQSVVFVAPEEDPDMGARALELGAQSFVVAPVQLDQVVANLSQVATICRVREENDTLRRQMNSLKSGSAMVGHSPAARRLATILARAAESSVTVLIEGPVGSGKSLAAQVIHSSSRQSQKRMEIAFCDVLTLDRAELLLQDQGVGSIVLENVDLLLPEVQSRVVRYIKEQSSQGPDGSGPRIVATTSAHLPELVARNRFREDLYYRLNMFPVAAPALRERRGDIAELAAFFLETAASRTGDPSPGFTQFAMAMLEGHTWPGNIGQLQETVVRANLLARGEPIDRRHLHGVTTGISADVAVERSSEPSRSAADGSETLTEDDILPLETEEKRLLARALKATQGNVRRAAQLLRIGRATLYRKIQVYKLKLN